MNVQMSPEETKPEFVLKNILLSALLRASSKFRQKVEKYSPSVSTVKQIKQSLKKKVPVYIPICVT